MKEARLNMVLSQELYDKLKAEAEKYNVSIASYVRALLARQFIGRPAEAIVSAEHPRLDREGAFIFEIGKKEEEK
jgi:hypothetical protein